MTSEKLRIRLAFDHIEGQAIRPNCLIDPEWPERLRKAAEQAASAPVFVRAPGKPHGRLWFLETFEASDFDGWIELGSPAAMSQGSAPWFYPVGVVPRDVKGGSESSLIDRIPPESLEALKASNGFLLIDHSQEGMVPPAREGKKWPTATRMIKSCRRHDLDPRKVIWLTPNLHVESFFPRQTIRPLTFHFSLANVPRLYRHQMNDPEACTTNEWVTQTFRSGALRPYCFLSLNRVPRPARFCLGLWLERNGYLDRGLVSLPQVTKEHVLSVGGGGANLGLDLEAAPCADLFANYDSLYARLPLNVDRDFSADKFTELGKPNVGNFNKLRSWMYQQSYFSIVTETNFDAGPLARFTEKTWKPLINFHPIMLFASPGCLAEFRQLGFQSFSPMIDERYDTIAEPNQRLTCLLEEIGRLVELKPEDLHAAYRDVWPTLQHNRRHAFVAASREKAELISNLAAMSEGDARARTAGHDPD